MTLFSPPMQWRRGRSRLSTDKTRGHRGEGGDLILYRHSFYRLYKPILQFLKVSGFTSLKNLWAEDAEAVFQEWMSFDLAYPLILVLIVNYVLFRFRVKSKLSPDFIVESSDVMALILINYLYMIQNCLVVFTYMISDRKLPELLRGFDAYDRKRGKLENLRKYRLFHIPNFFSFLAMTAYFVYSEWGQVVEVFTTVWDDPMSSDFFHSIAWTLILLYYFLVWDIVPYLIILFCLEIKSRFVELREFTKIRLESIRSNLLLTENSLKCDQQDVVLEELRLLHSRLSGLTILLADTFAFQLLIMFLNKYLNIIFTLYLAFFRRDMTMDGNIQVLVFDYANAFIISLLSEKIDYESRIFESDLEVTPFDRMTKNSQIVIRMFICQLQRRSIKINVCGFFILDRLLFSSMTVTLVTHFIVIMQMTPDLHKLLKSLVNPAQYDGSNDPDWTKAS